MRYFKNIFLAVAVMALCASCDIETSDNGPLDGFWHLEKVDTLATGGSRQMGEQRVFWSFQGHLLSVVDKIDPTTECVLRFAHEGEELKLSEPHRSNREEGDPPLTTVDALRMFGINVLEESFVVETLKGRKMVLRGKDVRLIFKKF